MRRSNCETFPERWQVYNADSSSWCPGEDHCAGEWAAEIAGSDCHDCRRSSSHRFAQSVPCLGIFSHTNHKLRMCFYKPDSFNFLIAPNGSQDLPAMLGICPPPLTSTPHRAAPPPPPPPLPPPCPITSSTETLTVSELIRKRRKEKDPDKVVGQDSVLKRGPDVKGMPSMLVVLKDLNQVKLRSVERYY